MKSPWKISDAVVLPASIAGALAFVLPVLYRGWVPFDEGWMLEQALRVAEGQLPHRDYGDLWTGGWSLVHAALFRLFGPSMALMRTVVLATWTLGLVLTYRVARWWVEPAVAGLTVLVAALWTLWAWQLPLLNWFYAPFALLAVVALRPKDGQVGHWGLAFAGAVAGLLFTFKLTGLYLLAALLLWAIPRAARAARMGVSAANVHATADARWLLAAACVLYAAMSLRLTAGMAGAESALVLIGGPNALLAAATARLAWREGPVGYSALARALGRSTALILAGFSAPLLLFSVPYAASGSLDSLIHGVFVAPLGRLEVVSFPPPWWRLAAKLSLPSLLLWWGVPRAKGRDSRNAVIAAGLLGSAFGAALALLPDGPAYLAPALATVPLAIAGAWCWSVWLRSGDGNDTDVTLLVVAAASTAQLIQVPFATLNYLLASTPLVLVAGLAVAGRNARRAAVVFTLATLGAAGIIGARRIPVMNDEIKIWGNARPPSGDAIWIPRADSARYARVSNEVRRRLKGGGLFVFPYRSEFYYFTGTSNPTRHIAAFLASESELDPKAILPRLQSAGTSVVLLFPKGSVAWPAAWVRTERALGEAFPCEHQVDDWAVVRWRPQPGTPSCP